MEQIIDKILNTTYYTYDVQIGDYVLAKKRRKLFYKKHRYGFPDGTHIDFYFKWSAERFAKQYRATKSKEYLTPFDKFRLLLIRWLTPKNIINDDALKRCENMLKQRAYNRNGNTYHKGFVYVTLEVVDRQLKSIHVYHDFGSKPKGQRIDNNFITGLMIALPYFERI
jgi:hypothetical protein